MNYRTDRYGNRLSILGFGCMRFSRKLGVIDYAKAEEEIMTAYRAGVNYFDTAYIYPGSESLLGEVLEKNGIRDNVYIATKLPYYLIKDVAGMEKLFEEELRRLRTDHVDYYFMHMLSDIGVWQKLKDMGIEEWLEEKKRSGAIGQVGFSYHGGSDMFCRLIDAYDWDFCMIQYNYLDRHSQAGEKGLKYAHAKGLPVMIMEPLRGGKLATALPKKAKEIIENYPIQYTPAAWSLRWLWNQPEVTVVLSGMNSKAMVEENLATAADAVVGALGESEQQMLVSVAAAINEGQKVGCTGCAYCMPCPKGVDIPGTFAAYNRSCSEGKWWALADYFKCTAIRRNASGAGACIGCGKCEQHCPQNIPIRSELKNAEAQLEVPIYKLARRLVKLLKIFD
ncbi:MAG: aldo/keto reductase [Clostridia bacterium]|nr:aldo/keto reductase [Clostridia bacterium]